MQNTTSEYDLVSAWAKANFTLSVAQKQFVQQATDSLRKDDDCFMAIGPKLTKGRKPWLVALFAKNLHAYRLKRRAGEPCRCGECCNDPHQQAADVQLADPESDARRNQPG